MKYQQLALALMAPVLGVAASDMLEIRDAITDTTDHLLFDISLPEFIVHRNANDPSNLDFTSDGCTKSPDNPFGFPFTPACNRHDFGYQNARHQSRFTKAFKSRIDSNFEKDLNFQCDSVGAKKSCRALAKVYHAAVVAFGGRDATKRGEDIMTHAEYDQLVELYHQAVEEDRAAGLLPALDDE